MLGLGGICSRCAKNMYWDYRTATFRQSSALPLRHKIFKWLWKCLYIIIGIGYKRRTGIRRREMCRRSSESGIQIRKNWFQLPHHTQKLVQKCLFLLNSCLCVHIVYVEEFVFCSKSFCVSITYGNYCYFCLPFKNKPVLLPPKFIKTHLWKKNQVISWNRIRP